MLSSILTRAFRDDSFGFIVAELSMTNLPSLQEPRKMVSAPICTGKDMPGPDRTTI